MLCLLDFSRHRTSDNFFNFCFTADTNAGGFRVWLRQFFIGKIYIFQTFMRQERFMNLILAQTGSAFTIYVDHTPSERTFQTRKTSAANLDLSDTKRSQRYLKTQCILAIRDRIVRRTCTYSWKNASRSVFGDIEAADAFRFIV